MADASGRWMTVPSGFDCWRHGSGLLIRNGDAEGQLLKSGDLIFQESINDSLLRVLVC